MSSCMTVEVNFSRVDQQPDYSTRELLRHANGNVTTVEEHPNDSSRQYDIYVEPHSNIHQVLRHNLGMGDNLSRILAPLISSALADFGLEGIVMHLDVKVEQDYVFNAEASQDEGDLISRDLYNDCEDWVVTGLDLDVYDDHEDLGLIRGTGASEDAIGRLKKEMTIERKSLNVNVESENCIVCTDQFSDSDMIIDLPCHHIFHETCIFKWLRRQNTCPLCRSVPYDPLSSFCS